MWPFSGHQTLKAYLSPFTIKNVITALLLWLVNELVRISASSSMLWLCSRDLKSAKISVKYISAGSVPGKAAKDTGKLERSKCF